MFLVAPDPAHRLVAAPRSPDDRRPATEESLAARGFAWSSEIEAYTRQADHDTAAVDDTAGMLRNLGHYVSSTYRPLPTYRPPSSRPPPHSPAPLRRWSSVMPRRRTQPQRPVPNASTKSEGRHQVVDQLHGYALGSHATATAAEHAVRELTANPTAAIEAVEALDAAQTDPAAVERRILRRYGYGFSLRQDEMPSLNGRFTRLEALISGGHLAMVFSPAGQPYYTTPERYAQLSPRWIRDGDESFPAADIARLERRRPALELLPARKRYEPCELHGITLWRRLICGPRERFECQWGECTANRVTAYCERCVRVDPRRTFPLPPRREHDWP
ncbi:hypothetical protein ACFVWP_32615 [Streptomyces sp. NPDC058175]|uniref:hypothetical protein n=1 Tax=Streptomyces sp. NPDC058175 TaxID=3346367 RepID=UPI0036EF20F5